MKSAIAAPPRLKIVHLISNLDTGGAETMLYKLLVRMRPERFKNTVVSLTDEGVFAQKIRAHGITVKTLGMKRGIPSPDGLWKLCRLLKSDLPDVLQTWLYHSDTLGVLAGKLAGVRALTWNIRSVPNDLFNYSLLSKCLVRFQAHLSGFPNAVIVNSDAGRKFHEELGYRPKRWEVIPNGFDMDRFRPDPASRTRLRKELGLGSNAFLIGLVARYSPVKDHNLFLKAASVLLTRHPDTGFVLVGLGIDLSNSELVKLISDLNITSKVHLLGRRSDVERIIPALDIMTLASMSEGFPNVIGEAMACGVPCISTDVGDSAKIIGDTGRILKTRSPAALAEAWAELISVSSEERGRLGKAARERIDASFNLTDIVARYESLYEELAKCAA